MQNRTIGVIGGGQLARMMLAAAHQLGIRVAILAATAQDCASDATSHTHIGSHTDLETLRTFAQQVDILTVEHDHLDPEHAHALTQLGHTLRPGPQTLTLAHNKLHLRRTLSHLGLPSPAWTSVTSPEQLCTWAHEHGWPVILKTPRGGYDGKGVRVLSDEQEAQASRDWFAQHNALLVEEHVSFRRELAIMLARRPSGQLQSWNIVESRNLDGVCHDVIAPAPSLPPTLASAIREAATTIAEAVHLEGTLAVEIFETDSEHGFVINEVAARPHNTGHWSMDGSLTSQFEQHIRAICDLPLGPTTIRNPYTRMRNIFAPPTGAPDLSAALSASAEINIYLYGKEPRPGRKLGHMNALAHGDETPTQLSHRLDTLTAALTRTEP